MLNSTCIPQVEGLRLLSFYTKADAENACRQLSGSKIGSRTVRCGWAHHKKDAMQSHRLQNGRPGALAAHMDCGVTLCACFGSWQLKVGIDYNTIDQSLFGAPVLMIVGCCAFVRRSN